MMFYAIWSLLEQLNFFDDVRNLNNIKTDISCNILQPTAHSTWASEQVRQTWQLPDQ